MVEQWLGLSAFTTEGTGSIPGWGAKIPRAAGQLSLRATTTEARAPQQKFP